MALDWLGNLKFVDQSGLRDDELPVPRERALEGMPMRTSTGRVLIGFPAVRRALTRTPLGLVPGLLLYLPGLNHLGAKSYAWIAQHRGRDAVCESAIGVDHPTRHAGHGPVTGADSAL